MPVKEKDWRPRLPEAELHGRFIIAESALDEAARLLPTYRGTDGDHEGIVLMLGRELGDLTVILSVVAPEADHSPGHVMVNGTSVAALTGVAHKHGLAVLGQIHTHPSAWTEHSKGDDRLVLLKYDGMLSIIAPHYGCFGLRPVHSLGVHQLHDGRWYRVTVASAKAGIMVAPTSIDLRIGA
jgi:hypothetical protein